MEFAKGRLRNLIERHPDFYPMYTRRAAGSTPARAWTHWCDGFLPGMMWIVYGTGAQSSPERGWWRQQAIRYSKPLEPRKHDRDVHDLGFIFMSTYYRWFRLTQDPSLKAVDHGGGQRRWRCASRRRASICARSSRRNRCSSTS